MSDSTFIDFIGRYKHRPVEFVQDVLKQTPDPWQASLMIAAIPKNEHHPGSGQRLCAVKSGHGVGKSTCAAWIAIHNIVCYYPQKTVITAPTSSQLFDALFAELKSQLTRLPPVIRNLFETYSDRITLKSDPSGSFISCRTSRKETPEALQGTHSDRTLLLVDEASSIDNAVIDAAGGSLSNEDATLVCLGNPTRPEGFFFDAFTRLSDKWYTQTVSCLDSTRVSDSYIQEMEDRYGRDSNNFRIRVLGEFPESSEDTLISNEIVEAAVERDVDPSGGPIIWGLDIARYGSDRSALCKRQGNTILQPIKSWSNMDTMSLMGAINAEYEKDSEDLQQPRSIMCDVIGIGAAIVDRGLELSLPVQGINTGESAALSGLYKNLRTELWHEALDWFEKRHCKIPRDNRLMFELCSPRYSYDSTGRKRLETKDEMKKRLGHRGSPDYADSFVLTFANQAGIMAGSSQPWSQPLRRNLSIV